MERQKTVKPGGEDPQTQPLSSPEVQINFKAEGNMPPPPPPAPDEDENTNNGQQPLNKKEVPDFLKGMMNPTNEQGNSNTENNPIKGIALKKGDSNNIENAKANIFSVLAADSLEERYNPNRVPPRIDWAVRHGQANLIGTPAFGNLLTSDPKEEAKKICPCCGKTSNIIKLSLCDSTDKLYFLGSGMPLFFDYSWFIFFCLVISYLVYGIYATINFTSGDYCDEKEAEQPGYCGARWKTQISAGNTAFFDINGYEKMCATFLFFILFIVRVIFFRKSRKKNIDIDSEHTTPTDYSVKISGLPKDIKPKEVVDIFSKYKTKDGQQVKVQKVNFAYYIGDFIEAANKARLLRLKIASEKGKPENKQNPQMIKDLEKQQEAVKQQINTIKQKFKKEDQSDTFTGICFITFRKQLEASLILDKWGISFLGTVIVKYIRCLKNLYKGNKERVRGQVVVVTEPPEPMDIFWENLGTPLKVLIKTRIVTSILSIILLGFSFGAILLLKYGQVVYLRGKEGKAFIRTMLSFAISFSITFINGILGFSLRKLSAREKYETKTAYNIGVAKRIASAQFLNTSIIIVFINWLIHGNDLRDEIWSEKGLSNDAWWIMLFNIFTPPMSNFLNPFHLLRWMKRRSIIKQGEKCAFTQKEANFWFEGPPFDIAQRYANHIKTLMISLFFMPMLPLSLPAGGLSMITAHITEKYLIYRRHTSPEATGPKLCFAMFRFFDIVMLVYAMGQMVFDYVFRLEISGYSWLFFGFAMFHWIFGFHYLYKKIFKFSNNEAEINKTTYNDNRDQFFAEYDRCNPITQAAASKEYLLFLKTKKPDVAQKLGGLFSHLGLDKTKSGSATPSKKDHQKEADNLFLQGVHQLNLGGLDNYANQHEGLESYGAGFSGGGNHVGGIGDALLSSIGQPSQSQNQKNTDMSMLMLNNILMAQQQNGYGGFRYGRNNRQNAFGGLNQLDNAILGKLMFKNLPGGNSNSDTNQYGVNGPRPINSPGRPPQPPNIPAMNNMPYQTNPIGQNRIPLANTRPFSMNTGGFNQTGPLNNPPPGPDNPALRNLFGVGTVPQHNHSGQFPGSNKFPTNNRGPINGLNGYIPPQPTNNGYGSSKNGYGY